jgi:hypothetical protein
MVLLLRGLRPRSVAAISRQQWPLTYSLRSACRFRQLSVPDVTVNGFSAAAPTPVLARTWGGPAVYGHCAVARWRRGRRRRRGHRNAPGDANGQGGRQDHQTSPHKVLRPFTGRRQPDPAARGSPRMAWARPNSCRVQPRPSLPAVEELAQEGSPAVFRQSGCPVTPRPGSETWRCGRSPQRSRCPVTAVAGARTARPVRRRLPSPGMSFWQSRMLACRPPFTRERSGRWRG